MHDCNAESVLRSQRKAFTLYRFSRLDAQAAEEPETADKNSLARLRHAVCSFAMSASFLSSAASVFGSETSFCTCGAIAAAMGRHVLLADKETSS